MKNPCQRINPFDRATAEHVLLDRYRRALAAAMLAEQAYLLSKTEAESLIDKANRYADALRALGHGDKVPGQLALLDHSGAA
jgi:hypothetical protein